jgi:hypothetical protein
MSRVGFEPTIPVFERAKTVHALERAATVIGTVAKFVLHTVHYRWYIRHLYMEFRKQDKISSSDVRGKEMLFSWPR